MRRYHFSPFAIGALVLTASVGIFYSFPAVEASLRNIVESLVVPVFDRDPPERESEAATIAEQEMRIRELEEENAALRRLASADGGASYPKTLTRVLWYDPDPSRRAVRIAIPNGAAFVVGDAVTTPNGALVGIVEKAFRKSADVLLIDDPAFRLGVTMGDAIEGAASGNGRGALNIDFVPVERTPGAGTAVRASGKDGRIPRGLFAGWVAVRSEAPSGGIAALQLTPAADLRALDIVAVIASGTE